MTRQHTNPVIVGPSGEVSPLRQISLNGNGNRIDEGWLQRLIENSPSVLPLAEIDREFANVVHLCREMSTAAGFIDHVLVTDSGHLVLVECKLWRNPQARREVVGQILDYAAEISRYTSADFQREVNRKLKTTGDIVFEMVHDRFPDTEQISFNDSLTRNLRSGRMMLLIVGDGISEGVETIAEYLTKHSGLNFTLGLVELPMFELAADSIVVTPRVVAHTTVISRTVFQGGIFDEVSGAETEVVDQEPEVSERTAEARQFWAEFLNGLKLDDPLQPTPNPSGTGHMYFSLPIPGAGLRVYRIAKDNCVGLFLGHRIGTAGEIFHQSLIDRWDDSIAEALSLEGADDPAIADRFYVDSLANPLDRAAAFEWLRRRTNDFVNVFRSEIPRVLTDP
jgi:hypothetical protein